MRTRSRSAAGSSWEQSGLVLALFLVLSIVACAPRSSAKPSASDDRGPRAAAPSASGYLGVAEAKRMLAENADALVLDVRQPDEWNDDLGHLDGARLIPLPELSHRMIEIAAWRDKPVLVVCRVGVRSAQAAEMLTASGFHRVYNLEGGMEAWRRAGS
jgi:sulfur dioxygenase